VISAAREWPECEFVRSYFLTRYNVMNVNSGWLRPCQCANKLGSVKGPVAIRSHFLGSWQFVRPSRFLELTAKIGTHSIWNSQTTKLPFDDEEFDHVHVKNIARGVPENKVCCLVTITVKVAIYSRTPVGFLVCSRY
jgi:hypothetical protein